VTADEILGLARELPPDVRVALARGLCLATGSLGLVGQALLYDLDSEGVLPEIAMRAALKTVAYDVGLLERLELAEEPLWVAVREAALEARSEWGEP